MKVEILPSFCENKHWNVSENAGGINRIWYGRIEVGFDGKFYVYPHAYDQIVVGQSFASLQEAKDWIEKSK